MNPVRRLQSLDRRVLGTKAFIGVRERRRLLADLVSGRSPEPDFARRGRLWAEHTLDPSRTRRLTVTSLVLFGVFALLAVPLLFTSHVSDGVRLLTLIPISLLSLVFGRFLARKEAEDLLRVLPPNRG